MWHLYDILTGSKLQGGFIQGCIVWVHFSCLVAFAQLIKFESLLVKKAIHWCVFSWSPAAAWLAPKSSLMKSKLQSAVSVFVLVQHSDWNARRLCYCFSEGGRRVELAEVLSVIILKPSITVTNGRMSHIFTAMGKGNCWTLWNLACLPFFSHYVR